MASRPPAGPAAARAAPGSQAGRALVALVVLVVVGAAALARLPAEQPPAASPVLPPEVVAEHVGPAEPGTGRHRLRSVSTAPSRPRLGDREAGSDPDAVAHRPVLRLDGADGATLDVVLADPDVAHAAAIELAEVALADGAALTVGAVDPAAFRPLAPPVSARAPGVWAALDGGGLLLSPEQSARLGARAGTALARASGAPMPVVGTASNGAPPLVHALTDRLPADATPLGRTVLVAVHPERPIPAVADRLGAATGTRVGPMPAPEPAVASLVGSDAGTVAAFEPFTYAEAAGGRIAIDPAWEAAHIVREQVPILGAVRCHRLLVPPLRAALQQVVDEGLADRIDPADYGGCYLPRHIDWNADAGLSMHAWGLAVDLNVATNPLGAPPQLDPRVVEVFEAHGFTWGGHWRRPDGMHLELNRLPGGAG